MSTHVPGFQYSFLGLLHHYALAKLATSSIIKLTYSCLENYLPSVVWTIGTFLNIFRMTNSQNIRRVMGWISLSNIFWKLLLLERYYQNSQVVLGARGMNGLKVPCKLRPILFYCFTDPLYKFFMLTHPPRLKIWFSQYWAPSFCILAKSLIPRIFLYTSWLRPLSLEYFYINPG